MRRKCPRTFLRRAKTCLQVVFPIPIQGPYEPLQRKGRPVRESPSITRILPIDSMDPRPDGHPLRLLLNVALGFPSVCLRLTNSFTRMWGEQQQLALLSTPMCSQLANVSIFCVRM